MSEPVRYCLISDESGHEYVCPVDRSIEALGAISAVERYWESGTYSGDPPPMPDFVERLDGRLTFTDPRVD